MAAEDNKVEKKSDGKGGIKSFIAGGCGGVCVVLSGHPFDTIKVRMQTMPLPAPGQSPMYAGAIDCVKKTLANEGPKGLYKGMAAPLVGVAPIFALSFWGNDFGKTLIRRFTGSQELGLAGLALAGGFSGIGTTIIMAPGERIKCILQTQQQGGAVKYSGPVDVAKSLYREGGMRSIYKGTVATLLRDVPASAMYFASYEVIMRLLVPAGGSTSDLNMMNTIFAGGMAGIFNWMVALPPDVVKSRLQSAPEGQFKNTGDVVKVLLKEQGPKGFFKGAGPVMTRAFPANACCFLGYEAAMRVMNKFAPDS